MVAIEMSRTQRRQHLPSDIRIERLEEDADVFERNQYEQTATMNAIKARTTGVLIALVVASLMLAANLAIGFKG